MEFTENSTSEGPENIWIASSDGDIARVQELISTGTNVNEQDDTGYSPIHAAVSYGHMQLVEILIRLGANPNLTDVDGDTPLHVCEKTEVAELLIDNGANPSALNNSNQSIYDVALGEENDEMVQYLVSKGLDTVSSPVAPDACLEDYLVQEDMIEEDDQEEDQEEDNGDNVILKD
eukprot:CAMPEP_0182419486 /NCGR_PEP_ID=MMETSP1167-20130531/3938_1 /TAXON_ID=2988 /ORGANISM="Mallomonas Sp, Strain CCMP3275" /LENGTH=175 /DNA_ID=CAMNT_0024594443 /DNA_START=102 /DNA_END=629 /DNA_ORIENTATION=+